MALSQTRCVAVWLAATATVVAVGRWAAPDVLVLLDAVGDAPFADLLAAVAALVLVGCAAWSWTVCTVVVLAAVRADGRRPVGARPGVPPWAQRLVLAACGAALIGTTHLAPASATSGPTPVVGRLAGEEPARGTSGEPGVGTVAGLPLPDRTTGPLAPDRGPAGQVLTVQPGDSLWSIAERLLAPDARALDVAELVERLHGLNRAGIGPDPDLIHPGHQLRTPPGARPAR